jgi:hypothetical protein
MLTKKTGHQGHLIALEAPKLEEPRYMAIPPLGISNIELLM